VKEHREHARRPVAGHIGEASEFGRSQQTVGKVGLEQARIAGFRPANSWWIVGFDEALMGAPALAGLNGSDGAPSNGTLIIATERHTARRASAHHAATGEP
jgi:hypothetical protein